MSTGYSISDFSKGMKVVFGRGNGEQTLGEVVKVNPKKLKIKQLESRGTMRSYPVGTIWTVPPSLCRPADAKAAPAPTARPSRPAFTRQSPREALAAKGINTGDRVEFTFRGRTYEGTIRRINQKRVTIEDVNSPSLARGVYANPSSIIRKVGTAAPAPKLNLPVGQTVEFQGFSWAARGQATIQGVVTQRGNGTYEVYGEGRSHNLKPSEVTKVGRRDEDTIISECNGVYAGLSPENLTCDGEASRTHVRRMAALYNRALKALFIELGREVSEGECWRAYDAKRANG